MLYKSYILEKLVKYHRIRLTRPLVAPSSAIIIFIVVVFPAPLCPRSPNTSPASTASDKLLTATLLVTGSSSRLQQQSQILISVLVYSLWRFCRILLWIIQRTIKIFKSYMHHDYGAIRQVTIHNITDFLSFGFHVGILIVSYVNRFTHVIRNLFAFPLNRSRKCNLIVCNSFKSIFLTRNLPNTSRIRPPLFFTSNTIRMTKKTGIWNRIPTSMTIVSSVT